MKYIVLHLSDEAEKVVTYLAEENNTTPSGIIVDAINEYYSDEIREYKRKEK